MASHQGRALVVGGGIAGPVHAYWLAKGGFKVTIIERSPDMFKSGQGIDVEGPAREIVQRMNVEDRIKEKTTGEEGFALLDDDANEIATIPGGLTRSLEIMRGNLAEIFVNAATALPDVDIRWGTSPKAVSQTSDVVTVTYNDDTTHEFDIVIGADGLRSKTRRLIFPADSKDGSDCFKPRDQYIAYFSIPREEHDQRIARWQNAQGGRAVLVRPAHKTVSSAYLNLVAASDELEEALASRDVDRQKRTWAEIFGDVTGEGPRVVREMQRSDDFYFERIAQVKLGTWSQGRCALVGDAAYAPSPITGEGTNLALVGAYVLAGELSETPLDPKAAFAKYEERLRVFVDKAQSIPLGGVGARIINPESKTGIWLLRTAFEVLAWTGLWKVADTGEPEGMKLPEYPKMWTG
ncbi:Ubiquinone biosynthesis monooxygenase COQ6, mitochondrial [Sphaceloma murrayae]|uniref:Ubiquinone biosynthesis monooxygenase COQ6, mitochondrial n=1 Tax=Sphaceloma murrayae TaxID=2082308 RepID=A0A2K1R2R2_9PEZI|nr:Ubiquinone biosynthesis monooxygenase COQ6, mitochondrial [Sphaceloma murrayae]